MNLKSMKDRRILSMALAKCQTSHAEGHSRKSFQKWSIESRLSKLKNTDPENINFNCKMVATPGL